MYAHGRGRGGFIQLGSRGTSSSEKRESTQFIRATTLKEVTNLVGNATQNLAKRRSRRSLPSPPRVKTLEKPGSTPGPGQGGRTSDSLEKGRAAGDTVTESTPRPRFQRPPGYCFSPRPALVLPQLWMASLCPRLTRALLANAGEVTWLPDESLAHMCFTCIAWIRLHM